MWLCQVRMLIKEIFFQHQLCLFSSGDSHLQKMASCNFYLNTWKQKNFSQIAMIKKPNYLMFSRTVSGLNVDEPKLSSMLALRVELKERKREICRFKLCSSKLTITSLTRSDLSAISTRTLSCSLLSPD